AVGQVDHVHHPEDEREARRDQEDEQAVGQPIQELDEGRVGRPQRKLHQRHQQQPADQAEQQHRQQPLRERVERPATAHVARSAVSATPANRSSTTLRSVPRSSLTSRMYTSWTTAWVARSKRNGPRGLANSTPATAATSFAGSAVAPPLRRSASTTTRAAS